jgi:rhodanese-related sulfurtransferase
MHIDRDFQNIKVKKLKPKEINEQFKQKEYYILDVRPLSFQRDTSFIQGARLCPLVYLADRYKELPNNRKIIITDWAMKQSPPAAKFLITKGFQIEGVLQGGMERWKSEKLPYIEKSPSGEFEPLDSE